MCNKCSTNTSSAASPKGDDASKTRLRYQIAVMQAAVDGKEIEYKGRAKGSSTWVKAYSPEWDWHNWEYRVKPREPREFFIKYYPTRHRGTAYDSYVEASEFAVPNSEKIIKVREVIEDEPTSSCCTCWGKCL